MSNRTTFIDTAIAASETLTATLKVKKATEASKFSPATMKVEKGKKPVPLTGAEVKKRTLVKTNMKVVKAYQTLQKSMG